MSYTDASRRLDGRGLTITIIVNASVAGILLSIAHSGTLSNFVSTPTTNYPSDPPPLVEKPVERRQVEVRKTDPYIPPRDSNLVGDVASTNRLTPLPTPVPDVGIGPVTPPAIPDPIPVIRASVTTMAKPDPRFASALQPAYPTSMIRAGLSGMVVVRVLVGPDGRVKAIETVRADEEAFLAATRDQAMKKWRFNPATRDGQPVEAWREMTVRFVLPD